MSFCVQGLQLFKKPENQISFHRHLKGSDHCFIGDLTKIPGLSKTHLTGCIGEIIDHHWFP